MGNYFSSIKVEDVANVTNATNDAEHDDVLVLSAKSVDPLEIKNDENNENNVDDENVVITVEEKKDLDLSSLSSSSSSGYEYETRTTINDVVYTKKNIKKKNKNKKNKGKGVKK
jgi:hypothetical protein